MGILLTEAAEVPANAGGSFGFVIILYALMFAAVWFFMLRPSSKEKKRVSAMLSALEEGDSVLTTSGFYGTVIAIPDDTVIVELGNNKNCLIPREKSAITRVEKPGEA